MSEGTFHRGCIGADRLSVTRDDAVGSMAMVLCVLRGRLRALAPRRAVAAGDIVTDRAA
jgi:hypothetical protein